MSEQTANPAAITPTAATMKKTLQNKSSKQTEMIQLPGGIKTEARKATLTVIILLSFMVFAFALQNNFLSGWDDGEYLSDPSVSGAGPVNTKEIFSNFHLGMYQPIAVLSFAINYKISGPEPWVFILTNIFLHLLNIVLVFKLMEKWMNSWKAASVVALLFAIHPMHVEPVVWISSRSTGLYSLFFLLGLLWWEKYQSKGKKTDYLLVFAFALLAMLSKSMAATFPLVLLVSDYLKNRKLTWKLIAEKLPFLALSVIFGLVAIKASASFGHITVLEQDYSIFQRLFLIVYSVAFYIIKLVVPVNLSAIYAYPELKNGALPLYVYTSAIVPLALLAFLLLTKRNKREMLAGAFFFLVNIGMVLPLFWSRIFITADRYTYLPYLGLFMLISRPLTNLWEERNTLDRGTLKLLIAATALIIITLSAGSINRIKVWKDTPTLLTDVIDNKRSDADMAHGYFYLGNYFDGENNAEQAMKYYDLALSRNDKYLLALNNRGILKGKTGNLMSAISDFENAIKIQPAYAEAYYNRGVALYQTGKKEEACADWKKALSLKFVPASQALNLYCRQANTSEKSVPEGSAKPDTLK